MNTRYTTDLEAELNEAFALELADHLDKLIDGYHFEWYMPNGMFSIRTNDRRFCMEPRGNYDAVRMYMVGTTLLISHGSKLNKKRQQKVQTERTYDLMDPKTSVGLIANDLAQMIANTRAYAKVSGTIVINGMLFHIRQSII